MTDGEPFEEFEHASDLGLRVRGRTLREMFENAGRGLARLMADPAGVNPSEALELEASGDDNEMLLVAWLGEVLYAFEVEHFVPHEVEVLELEAGRLKGLVRGERFDAGRHEIRHAIKAVTYHNLNIREGAGGYEADIILDV